MALNFAASLVEEYPLLGVKNYAWFPVAPVATATRKPILKGSSE